MHGDIAPLCDIRNVKFPHLRGRYAPHHAQPPRAMIAAQRRMMTTYQVLSASLAVNCLSNSGNSTMPS
jgi:hypothetical protein